MIGWIVVMIALVVTITWMVSVIRCAPLAIQDAHGFRIIDVGCNVQDVMRMRQVGPPTSEFPVVPAIVLWPS